jgi:hypothetical protein
MRHPLRPTTSLLLLAGAALASSCSTAPPDGGDPGPYVLHVVAQDQFGAPYDSVNVLGYARRDTARTRLRSAMTNALGQAMLMEDPLPGPGAPDTILIVAYGTDCLGHPGFSTTITPDSASTSDTVHLPLTRLPYARLQPGESCGAGGGSGPQQNTLMLSIDSVTPTVYGRWAIGYVATIRTETGSFVGTPGGNIIQLHFTADSSSAPCATPYALTAALAGDTIVSARLTGGCIAPTGLLQLYPGDEPGFP